MEHESCHLLAMRLSKSQKLSDSEMALSEQSLYNCKNTTERCSKTVEKLLLCHIYILSIDLAQKLTIN